MKKATSPVLPVPVDGDLKSLIEAAAEKTAYARPM